ncbi:hypothetical protein [Nocardia sp. NPDC050710]|uniref:hypothetical protein n=1 Tax=Nocardia sp. NPDC050710 TaxID=3157220 RepID=UPI0033CCD833
MFALNQAAWGERGVPRGVTRFQKIAVAAAREDHYRCSVPLILIAFRSVPFRLRRSVLSGDSMRTSGLFAAAMVFAIAAAGCSSVSGTALPEGAVDPCSVLPLEVAAKYIQADKPVALRKGIGADAHHPAGFAECRYGTVLDTGVTLGFPLGKAAPDLADLAKSAYKSSGGDTTVGSDKAYLTTTEVEAVIAVQHGSVQFVVRWRRLSQGQSITEDQLKDLATTVAGRLPVQFTLPNRDIPPQCHKLARIIDITGAPTTSFGSATDDKLTCDFAGPDGILQAESWAVSDTVIQGSIRTSRKVSPETEFNPPLAAGTVTFVQESQFDGLAVEVLGEKCGLITVRFKAPAYDRKRGKDFDDAERGFVTNFIGAAENWKK